MAPISGCFYAHFKTFFSGFARALKNGAPNYRGKKSAKKVRQKPEVIKQSSAHFFLCARIWVGTGYLSFRGVGGGAAVSTIDKPLPKPP